MDREGFRNRLNQYKKAREENPGLKYWEWKSIPKYDEGTDEVYYAGTLPEVVVVPEKWQKDFSENFGDARIRRNVYRSMPIYTKHMNLLKARRKYNELQKLGQFTEDSRKAFKNKLDSLSNDYHTFVEDPDTPYRNVNDEIKRLYDVWNVANRPEITSKNSIFGDMFGFETPHWNPVNNSIHNTAHLHTIISELAHPIQYKVGDKNRLDDYLLGLPKAVYGRFSKHYDAYGDKNHYEYDTHRNIEPALQEYISHGKNTKYLNQFAEGGEVTGPPTYEYWQKSLIKNDLWMHPDYYMTYSLNSAVDALRQASAGLPGREATPPIPAPVEVKGEFPQEWAMNNLYSVENPKKKGVTKKYAKMYDSRTLGAGVDVVSGHPELYNKAKRFGIEKELADKIAYEHIVHDDQVIRDNYADIYGKAAADTLSFGPRFLVAQARYQQGNVRKGWDEIHNALAKGDAEALKKAVLKVTPEDHDYRKKWVKNFNVYGNEPE